MNPFEQVQMLNKNVNNSFVLMIESAIQIRQIRRNFEMCHGCHHELHFISSFFSGIRAPNRDAVLFGSASHPR
jgi:hypothetical protein